MFSFSPWICSNSVWYQIRVLPAQLRPCEQISNRESWQHKTKEICWSMKPCTEVQPYGWQYHSWNTM